MSGFETEDERRKRVCFECLPFLCVGDAKPALIMSFSVFESVYDGYFIVLTRLITRTTIFVTKVDQCDWIEVPIVFIC